MEMDTKMVQNQLINLGLLDYALILGLIGIGAFYLHRKSQCKNEFDEATIRGFNMVPVQDRQQEANFITKMKSHGRNIVVFYGSQTGTAEEFASRLAKESLRFGCKAIVADPEECDLAELVQLKDIPNSMAIFCLATYGEGDPTDNAQEFYDWLNNTEVNLSSVNYAVFGLGNKTYEHFNRVAITVDKQLERLGAQRIHELGLGDDDANIEEDFITWKEHFWASVCSKFNLAASGKDINLRQYKLREYDETEIQESQVYKGEILRLNGYLNQKLPFDAKNPFLAPIIENRELYKGERSCMHIELNIENSKIKYETGDHVGIYPKNNSKLVNRIGELLEANLDQIFTLDNLDEDSSKKHPFPCPCSYRTALTYYVDITSLPRTHILKELAEFANPEEKEFLLSMTRSTDEAKQLYSNWVVKNLRSIVHVLEDLPSVKIPLDHLLELLPRLNSRYYSISSSNKVHPKSIHLTAVYIEYKTPTNRLVQGVATSWLKSKQITETSEMPDEFPLDANDSYPGARFTVHKTNYHDTFYSVFKGKACPQIPIFVRRSQFKLPAKPMTPIIMVGPGTGVAPFRGFLQERKYLRNKYPEKEHGRNILYYGCRKCAEDYLYEHELKKYVEEGVLSKLYVAFSRDQEEKIYVTHLLKQNKDEIWDVTGKNLGCFYVCGDARTMAKDVREIVLQIIIEKGNKTQADAEQFLKQMELQRRYSADVWS